MNPLDAFDRILASLHQATLDDAHWPVTAALIDEAVGATGNSLTVSERFGDDVRVCFTGLYRRGERPRDRDGTLGAWLPGDHGCLQRLIGKALPAFGGEAPAGGSMTVPRPLSPLPARCDFSI